MVPRLCADAERCYCQEKFFSKCCLRAQSVFECALEQTHSVSSYVNVKSIREGIKARHLIRTLTMLFKKRLLLVFNPNLTFTTKCLTKSIKSNAPTVIFKGPLSCVGPAKILTQQRKTKKSIEMYRHTKWKCVFSLGCTGFLFLFPITVLLKESLKHFNKNISIFPPMQ
ncbi:hypothetical protein CHARACLAT_028437 [Characodon lateralis]|uniref:Uncharacterized protein n=1 Tax=Characodon lateralis TaxID=208331 RepID=A0ABU7EDL5_9TELE|nr:hypothetical protein [Characodon lateralis]